MEILFNELSLCGQFSDIDSFIRVGLMPFIHILKEMQGYSTLLLKKSDVWGRLVTPKNSLHSILIHESLRKYDEVRRLKVAIAELTREPFWDFNTKQNPQYSYNFEGTDIRGSSLAEACERDKAVVSFIKTSTSTNPVIVTKNGSVIQLKNLTGHGELTELLWSIRAITFETYVRTIFSSGRLDFSKVDPGMGFSRIEISEQAEFLNSFRLFEELTWEQIHASDGLKYKQYHGSLNAQFDRATTYKFRVSQRMRCHGFRHGEKFVVLGFETDHSLSDFG